MKYIVKIDVDNLFDKAYNGQEAIDIVTKDI